jgi:hypothetical protein
LQVGQRGSSSPNEHRQIVAIDGDFDVVTVDGGLHSCRQPSSRKETVQESGRSVTHRGDWHLRAVSTTPSVVVAIFTWCAISVIIAFASWAARITAFTTAIPAALCAFATSTT